MYKVFDKEGFVRGKARDLAMAMDMAKYLDEFVTITNGTIEIVGLFGVDSIVDGKTPDGLAYDWNKESRIGRNKNKSHSSSVGRATD